MSVFYLGRNANKRKSIAADLTQTPFQKYDGLIIFERFRHTAPGKAMRQLSKQNSVR